LGPTSAAGTVLVRKGQVRAHAQHAPTPIRAGIAGSHPDLIPGPVLRRDQPQSRCLQSVHLTVQINPMAACCEPSQQYGWAAQAT
jgi:hypothetical protein